MLTVRNKGFLVAPLSLGSSGTPHMAHYDSLLAGVWTRPFSVLYNTVSVRSRMEPDVSPVHGRRRGTEFGTEREVKSSRASVTLLDISTIRVSHSLYSSLKDITFEAKLQLVDSRHAT